MYTTQNDDDSACDMMIIRKNAKPHDYAFQKLTIFFFYYVSVFLVMIQFGWKIGKFVYFFDLFSSTNFRFNLIFFVHSFFAILSTFHIRLLLLFC